MNTTTRLFYPEKDLDQLRDNDQALYARVQAKAEQKEWFSTDELVRWLELGRTKTYEMLRSGEIPSYKIGRIRRIRRSDVEAWLERNRYRPGE